MTNNFFSPPAIIYGMIGLHTGNYFLSRETAYIVGVNMLSMFYTEPPVAFTVFFRYPVKNFQQRMDRSVANCMHHHLKASAIS